MTSKVDDIRNKQFPAFEELMEAGYVRDEFNGPPAEEFRKDIGRGEFSCPAGWSRLVTGEFGYRDSYGGFWTKKDQKEVPLNVASDDAKWAALIRTYSEHGDTEYSHIVADDLIASIVDKMGYHETAKAFLKMDKWFS